MPLTGLCVVSLAINLPGPVAAARLTVLGAHVTTVLPPAGDPLQAFDRKWFDDLHVGQRLVTLDLKTDNGIRDLHALLADADLLLTSSRPSALARLRLDPATVAERHPRLCQVAIVGHAGPDAERSGHDLTYQADAGLVRPPSLPPTLVADLAGAERAVGEALAAVRHRDRTGVGVIREVALADVAYDLAAPLRRGLTAPGGPLGGGLPGYDVYPTADGYIVLAALEPHFWGGVCELLGDEPSRERLAALFATESSAYWVRLGAERDLPIAAVPSDTAPRPRTV